MLTNEERATFRDAGVLALRRAVPMGQLVPVRDFVRGELARLGVTGRGRRSVVRDLPPFQQVTQLSTLLRFASLLDAITTPALRGMIGSLAEGRTLVPSEPQLLVSPPRQGEPSLDGARWHVDVARRDDERSPGVQLFVLVDDVAPRGGGTLALAGSHALAIADERALRAALRDGALEDARRAHQLSLVEMSGRAGDAFLMDLRVLHAPSINSVAVPRIMATSRWLAVA